MKLPVCVRNWVYLCCAMIFIMALLGAVTRLTESGLSITKWEPVMGALPPMNDTAWQKAFSEYQQIPQYQLLNRGMSLEEFKGIYFWEWFHRLWGRLIGLVFALPLIYFAATRKINRPTFFKLGAIFALGGLQGFIGWFMVQSGLEVRTHVSPYRLALHLGFALLLYALLLWQALPKHQNRAVVPVKQGWIALGLLAVTMTWGAFTAGLRAGLAFNTWPKMDGAWIPDGAFSLSPTFLNFFENTAAVQFAHRWLGPLTMVIILSWVARCWKKADLGQRKFLMALGGMVAVQVGLGISTLLTQVNIAIATLHQAGAIVLLTLLLINLRQFSKMMTTDK